MVVAAAGAATGLAAGLRGVAVTAVQQHIQLSLLSRLPRCTIIPLRLRPSTQCECVNRAISLHSDSGGQGLVRAVASAFC